ncbi:hypothetical protein C8R48DRAFT_780142 [Suillus tomentosus]|nr:hypothetical protein C8R48DRAFT_780142 [Suillus tomentosus]
MSRRPSITTCSFNTDGRRRLAPMRNNHPKLNKLRRCTSLEWVFNSDNDSDDSDDGRMVIRVGEDVTIYPLDQRAVQRQDGSLPVMSYWYGKVAEIYLKSGTQDVWLEIQWYYRQIDLQDEDVDLSACVGEYELVLSGHKSVVDMSCVEGEFFDILACLYDFIDIGGPFADHANILQYDEGDISQPQIPFGTLYTRWTIDIQFSRHGRTLYIEGVNIRPQDVDAIDAVPHFPPQLLSSDIAGNVVTGSTRNVFPPWDIPWVAM